MKLQQEPCKPLLSLPASSLSLTPLQTPLQPGFLSVLIHRFLGYQEHPSFHPPCGLWMLSIKGNKNFISPISTPLCYSTPSPTILTWQLHSDVLVSSVDTGHTLLSTDHCSHTWMWLCGLEGLVLFYTVCLLDNICLPPWPSPLTSNPLFLICSRI